MGGTILSNKCYKTSLDPDDKSRLSTLEAVNRVESIEDRLNPLVGIGPVVLDNRLKLIESDTKALYARISNLEEIVTRLSKKEDTTIRL